MRSVSLRCPEKTNKGRKKTVPIPRGIPHCHLPGGRPSILPCEYRSIPEANPAVQSTRRRNLHRTRSSSSRRSSSARTNGHSMGGTWCKAPGAQHKSLCVKIHIFGRYLFQRYTVLCALAEPAGFPRVLLLVHVPRSPVDRLRIFTFRRNSNPLAIWSPSNIEPMSPHIATFSTFNPQFS